MPGRHYIDLFAGTGLNVERGGGDPFLGSPLRALQMRSTQRVPCTFTDLVFVNKSVRHHDALERRIQAAYDNKQAVVPREKVQNLPGDANELLPRLLRSIPERDYVFVFADIQNPSHWPWESVRALRAAHQSVDLYLLFPIDMGLVRLAGYSPTERERWAPILDPFFGSQKWAEIADEFRKTNAQAPAFRRKLVELYLEGLQQLWGPGNANSLAGLRRRGDQTLYEMLFASREPIAHRIAARAALRMREYHAAGQAELPF